jgi:hypothetical protein
MCIRQEHATHTQTRIKTTDCICVWFRCIMVCSLSLVAFFVFVVFEMSSNQLRWGSVGEWFPDSNEEKSADAHVLFYQSKGSAKTDEYTRVCLTPSENAAEEIGLSPITLALQANVWIRVHSMWQEILLFVRRRCLFFLIESIIRCSDQANSFVGWLTGCSSRRDNESID